MILNPHTQFQHYDVAYQKRQNDKELYIGKQQLGWGIKQFEYAGLCQRFLKEFYLEIKLMP